MIWGSLREALRDSRISPSDYLDIVEEVLEGQPDITVETVIRDSRHAPSSTIAGYSDARLRHARVARGWRR